MLQQPTQQTDQNTNSNLKKIDVSILWEEVKFEDILDLEQKKQYINFKEASCYGSGIIANIKKAIVVISFNIAFVISALCLLISNNKSYKNYRETIKDNQLSNYEKFWCDFGKYEKGILISYFVLLISVLLFEIFSLLIHKKTIKMKIGNGFIYKMIIFINFIFYIIFCLYFSLLIYLFSLSILIVTKTPLKFREYPTIFNETNSENSDIANNNENINSSEEKEKSPLEESWENQIIIFIIYIIILFVIICLNSFFELLENSIKYYLSFNFIDLDENIDREEKIRNVKLFINGKYYDAKVKNKTFYLVLYENNYSPYSYERTLILYLKNRIKFIPFKQILIEGITNDYIYIRTANKAIYHQLSITDWEFPILNDDYNFLINLISFIFIDLNIYFSFFKLHIINENNYKVLLDYISVGIIKKPTYYKILTIYGSFEKNVSDSRFAFYLFAYVIAILYMFKRIYNEVFLKHSYLIVTYILSILFIILNVIYMILTIILIVFSSMCLDDFFYFNRDDYLVRNKIIAHLILNIFCFIYIIGILVYNVKLKNYLNDIIKDLAKLSEKSDKKDLEYKYKDLNNDYMVLKEFKIENFPRIFFYKCKNDNLEDNKNDIKEGDIININENKHGNNEINNQNEINIKTSERINIYNTKSNLENPVDYSSLNKDDLTKEEFVKSQLKNFDLLKK